jgi:putative component of membrane protein insertase Oxa1/YidC/SpoIIIJ protein YidD
LALLAVGDSFRAPAAQYCVPAYVGLVSVYRACGHRWLQGRVQCRFRPSCSHYSETAVRRHGIRRGLVLTWQRLQRCRSEVSFGTEDAVPES